MDTEMIAIFIGFILTGAVMASPVAFALGKRRVWSEVNKYYFFNTEDSEDILFAEIVEEKKSGYR